MCTIKLASVATSVLANYQLDHMHLSMAKLIASRILKCCSSSKATMMKDLERSKENMNFLLNRNQSIS
eukprot:m.76933 g.76933  ORF g.76933 m.76933 type:complete len:68 (+) comp12591_c0_seq1:1498-1701(+)